ncbi:hypothetical protein ACOSQ4_003840 [Xanthoceras sorbifolium]
MSRLVLRIQLENSGPSHLVGYSTREYSDVNAYRLSLSEDTKALNQLNTLIQEGKEMASVIYTYRSCVKALPQSDPVIPAFPDLHLSPAAILKELSMYFQKFSAQTRLLTLPAPHEIPPREAQEYPSLFFS